MYMNEQTTLRLPSIISDGMILQRNKKVTIWGWDQPSQLIQVSFEGQQKEHVTSLQGKWEIVLDTLPTGGPYQMIVKGSSKKIITDIYVGEVWLAGGQSNMEMELNRTLDLFEDDILQINNSLIREFHVPISFDFHGPKEEEAEPSFWKTATQESVQNFSAVAFYFAQKLQKELQVPVGIIMTAVGGTPAEAWLDKEDLEEMPAVMEELQQLYNDEWVASTQKNDEARIQNWYETVNHKENWEWASPEFDDSEWRELAIPTMFHQTELAGAAGSIWFRKTFHVENPDLFKNQSLLRLGAIIDYDEAYLNGILVGKTDYRYPPRRYPLPDNLLKQGENVLAVRVILNGKTGGFVPGKKYGIESKLNYLDLQGKWKYKRSREIEEFSQMTFFHYKPTGLFNSMLYPIKNYTHNGFLFYQGESNTGQPENYARLLEAVILRWRKTWNDLELPFRYVQLPNYHEEMSFETDTRWAELRQQQALVETKIPQVAMTVSIDLGEGNDLHPQNKKDIGERLAEDALQLAYHYSDLTIKPSNEMVSLISVWFFSLDPPSLLQIQ